jgi:hypothetical protein
MTSDKAWHRYLNHCSSHLDMYSAIQPYVDVVFKYTQFCEFLNERRDQDTIVKGRREETGEGRASP